MNGFNTSAVYRVQPWFGSDGKHFVPMTVLKDLHISIHLASALESSAILKRLLSFGPLVNVFQVICSEFTLARPCASHSFSFRAPINMLHSTML